MKVTKDFMEQLEKVERVKFQDVDYLLCTPSKTIYKEFEDCPYDVLAQMIMPVDSLNCKSIANSLAGVCDGLILTDGMLVGTVADDLVIVEEVKLEVDESEVK